MQIRFQGNYNITGPNPQTIQNKMDELDLQSKVAIGVVTNLKTAEGEPESAEKFGGFLLTDEDAVTFLNKSGIPVLMSASREENENTIQQGLDAREADGTAKALSEALCMTSYILRFVEEKFTEIKLPN